MNSKGKMIAGGLFCTFVVAQIVWRAIESETMKRLLPCLMILALAGCGTRAVISDLESDKVKVQANGGDMNVINAEAQRGCAIHNKTPVQISYRCLDGYCIQKEWLYACK